MFLVQRRKLGADEIKLFQNCKKPARIVKIFTE
jgi:hypothetical protein